MTVRELLERVGRGDVGLDDEVEVVWRAKTEADEPPPPKRSLEDPCPHPARNGHHEIYIDGDGAMHCRACGAGR